MLRLRVAEYFDSVVNEIDLYTETKIQSIMTQSGEDWLNQRRREQIDEIKRIERVCLDHVNTVKVEDKEIESGEWVKRVFVEYCFTVDYGLLYLVKANRYVEPRERRVLDVHLNPGRKLKIQINSQQCFYMTINEFESDLLAHFLTQSPLIDISSGLDQCCCIKMACVYATRYTEQTSPILFNLAGLSIQECSLSFRIENADQENETVNVIKYLMNRDLVKKIKARIEYQNTKPSHMMSEFLQFIEPQDEVTFKFGKHCYSMPCPCGLLETCFNHSVRCMNRCSEITFDQVLQGDLEKAYHSCVHSPKDIYLSFSAIDSSDLELTFLDSFRESLESLDVDCIECQVPVSISCRAFSRMANLKTLSIFEPSLLNFGQEQLFSGLTQLEKLDIYTSTTPFPLSRKTFSGLVNLKSLSLMHEFSIKPENELFAELSHLEHLSIKQFAIPFILSRKMFSGLTNLRKLDLRGSYWSEPDDQGQAFAELVHLQKLTMHLSKETNCQVNSCSVEELDLSFSLDGVASLSARFNVPKLASLSLNFNDAPVVCDLKCLMSCFSHVKKLRISTRRVDIMTRGWFRILTNVEDLNTVIWDGHIDSQIYQEFEHVTQLTFSSRYKVIFDPRAFHKLVNLQKIVFNYRVFAHHTLDLEDESIFDGLSRLETIKYIGFERTSKSYVYFKNLSRCILVDYS